MPGPVPVTLPDTASTTATPVLLLLHVPPVVALLSVVDDDTHTEPLPVIPVSMEGRLTTSVAVALPGQPNRLVTV